MTNLTTQHEGGDEDIARGLRAIYAAPVGEMYWNELEARIMGRIVEVKEFAERLPGRVNKILDAVGNNELSLRVDAIDEKVVLSGLQKIANRITLGLVLAALIVGAALMMRVETSFKIWGYPGIAMIFFMLAAVASLFLAANILFTDEQPKKKSDDD